MFEQKTEKKCALFLADGFEEVEALTVSDLLFRAGIPTALVSVNKEPVVTSSHDLTVVADICIDALDLNDYDMLILPGGMPGTPNLKNSRILTDALKEFFEAGKPVSAICAAPTILAELGLLSGKKATCYPTRLPVLAENGAEALDEQVVRCGNILTSQGVGTAIPFALAIIESILGKERADEIAASIVYQR